MDCSTPGFPVHHQLPEPTQSHVHHVGDAILPSQLLSSPSTPALNLSQHQGLFKWVSSLHQVAKVLEFQLPMNTQDWSPLGCTGWISLQSKGLSRVFYNTTVQKHQFFGSQLSFSHVTILKFLIIFEQGSCSTLYWSPQKYVANPRKISGLIFSNSQSINFSLKFSHLWAIKFLY